VRSFFCRIPSALLACGLALQAITQSPAQTSSPTQTQYQFPFQNPALPPEERITDLLHRMTLQEKVAALSTDPSVPRLGVIGTGHVEGLHGEALGGPGHWEGRGKHVIATTMFPQARGLGQTWDPALLRQAAAVEGFETRYFYDRYGSGGLVVRAPNADLSRDPRWGRSEESYGEDPFLVGTLTVAYVKGLQGDNPKYWMTASLMKHFLANSNEKNRDGSSSNFDDRLFYEYYSMPFRMGIEQGGSNAFMTSYNAWNSIPMDVNPVLHDVVMKDWGFNGIICTDAGALTNLVTRHQFVRDMEHAAADTLKAGINQYLDRYEEPVDDALKENLTSEAQITENLRGVYRVMIKLGELDPQAMVPYARIGTADAPAAELAEAQQYGDPQNWPSHRALARQVTDESIVLLKNEDHTLPLDAAKLKKIAVIGPYADIVAEDWYGGTPPAPVSPLAGIKQRLGSGVTVSFDKGEDVQKAADLARSADAAIVVIGNHPTCNAGWFQCPVLSDGKEAIDRLSMTLEQEDIAKAVYAANPHTIVVLNASFPYTTTWSQANVPAILEMTHSSEAEGTGLADVLFGDYNPAGRLTQTWVASMSDLPPMMDYNIRDGRTYMYAKQKPLYPFGYGLSYTTFKYSHLTASTPTVTGATTISVDVTNTGSRAGDEVVQLYVSHEGSRVARPIEGLKGFDRVHLDPGQTQTVTIPLPNTLLAYWDDAAKKMTVEPDRVELRVGSSSADIRLRKAMAVTP
jgi:beta-glucosidase